MFKDGWIHELGPQEWSSPGASLDSEVFWKTFQDCSTKLPKNVALRRTRWHIAEPWFVCRGKTAHHATLARSGEQKIVRISAALRRSYVVITHSTRVRRRNRLEFCWFAGGYHNELAR